DDLRLDRLRDGRLDDGGGSAGKVGRHYGLRRHDVRELRNRDARQGQQPSDRDHDRNDDREPWPVDKDRRNHCVAFGSLAPSLPSPACGGGLGWGPLSCAVCGAIGGGGLAGPGDTTAPGRTRCSPSLITSSPSLRPFVTTAVEGVDWPSWMGRRCA